MSATVTRIDDQRLQITGDLTFRTVMQVRAQLEQQLADARGEQLISLANIDRVDSSALSLWLCIQRWARLRQLTLQAIDLPDDVRALGRLVGMNRSWAQVPDGRCEIL